MAEQRRRGRRKAPGVQLVAARVLREVIDQGRSLDRTLEAESATLPTERLPRLRELCYGGCRYYFLFDGLLSRLMDKPIRAKDRLVHFLLVVGLYQLEFLRTPDHAAVDETVAAVGASRHSWARGLVNGVLRSYIRGRDHGAITAHKGSLSAAQQASFSEMLYNAIVAAWPEQAGAILGSSIARPPMTLRVNRQKATRDDYLTLLGSHKIPAKPTRDSADGVVLTQPRPVNELPMFDAGWCSVQDESAQLCTELMSLAPRLNTLDGCAAPGGKTCAMLESEPTLRMTALDLPERVETIRENLERLGLHAEVRDSGLFDHEAWSGDRRWQRILLDVPCSGSGVIRRHPDILHRREAGDLRRFADQQLQLLEAAWELLGKDGVLLYVTCSILPVENDEIIDRFLAKCADVTVRELTPFDGITTRYGRQRLPGLHPGDGFYYCRLEKL